jgi:hypothetical protein
MHTGILYVDTYIYIHKLCIYVRNILFCLYLIHIFIHTYHVYLEDDPADRNENPTREFLKIPGLTVAGRQPWLAANPAFAWGVVSMRETTLPRCCFVAFINHYH